MDEENLEERGMNGIINREKNVNKDLAGGD